MQLFYYLVSTLIGSGIFFLPYSMSIYGLYGGILYLVLAILLFTYLGYVFHELKDDIYEAQLQMYGYTGRFLINWIYWVISWLSTIVVINELTNEIVVGILRNQVSLCIIKLIKICLVLICIILNICGSYISEICDQVLSVSKVFIVVIVPILCMMFRKYDPIQISSNNLIINSLPGLVSASWCFLGVEVISILKCNTSSITIIMSIIAVGSIYLINLISIFLTSSKISARPYVDVMQNIFGNTGGNILSVSLIIVCLGTLNSWVSASSYFAYEASNNNVFPAIFKQKNRFNVPWISFILSNLPLIILTIIENTSLTVGLTKFADLSSSIFHLFYLSCVVLYYQKTKSIREIISGTILLLLFLTTMDYTTFIYICISGVPFYLMTPN